MQDRHRVLFKDIIVDERRTSPWFIAPSDTMIMPSYPSLPCCEEYGNFHFPLDMMTRATTASGSPYDQRRSHPCLKDAIRTALCNIGGSGRFSRRQCGATKSMLRNCPATKYDCPQTRVDMILTQGFSGGCGLTDDRPFSPIKKRAAFALAACKGERRNIR